MMVFDGWRHVRKRNLHLLIDLRIRLAKLGDQPWLASRPICRERQELPSLNKRPFERGVINIKRGDHASMPRRDDEVVKVVTDAFWMAEMPRNMNVAAKQNHATDFFGLDVVE